jgi:hypothetical protein
MSVDINQKASNLLERLANSIYDRDQGNIQQQPFFFSLKEVAIVQEWLKETLDETKRNDGQY